MTIFNSYVSLPEGRGEHNIISGIFNGDYIAMYTLDYSEGRFVSPLNDETFDVT